MTGAGADCARHPARMLAAFLLFSPWETCTQATFDLRGGARAVSHPGFLARGGHARRNDTFFLRNARRSRGVSRCSEERVRSRGCSNFARTGRAGFRVARALACDPAPALAGAAVQSAGACQRRLNLDPPFREGCRNETDPPSAAEQGEREGDLPPRRSVYFLDFPRSEQPGSARAFLVLLCLRVGHTHARRLSCVRAVGDQPSLDPINPSSFAGSLC